MLIMILSSHDDGSTSNYLVYSIVYFNTSSCSGRRSGADWDGGISKI